MGTAEMSEPVASRFTQFSESDFDRLSWHDCRIWGIAFRTNEPIKGDWISELVLDIDFICEWCCDNAEGRFRVAPANLVFHGVESLAIAIRHVESSAAYPLSIAEITCATNNASTRLWRIALNGRKAEKSPSARWVLNKLFWPNRVWLTNSACRWACAKAYSAANHCSPHRGA
jgi:hypothetical protein